VAIQEKSVLRNETLQPSPLTQQSSARKGTAAAGSHPPELLDAEDSGGAAGYSSELT
jgi:hypothetical protein